MTIARRRKALLVVNRRSRNGRELADRAFALLADLGFDLLEVPRVRGESVSQTLLRLGKRGASLAIIGGGDGTLNSAIDALARLRLPVGVLPLGTANDFARTLGIPQTLPEACQVVAEGRTRRIDLGTVNGKFFLNDVSMGVSSAIACRLTTSAKKRWGVFAAAGMALRAASKARRFRFAIRVGRRTIDSRAYQVTIGNGVHLGGVVSNFDASIDDGLLDLYALETKRAGDVARMLPFAVQGRYEANPYVLTAKGKRFVVRAARRLRIFTDGEAAGTTPAVIAVAPGALRVFVPARTK